jgi:hypothetical protein
MESYYEKHKEERKAYQKKYRALNLEDIRKKDQERKRKKYKSADKGARPVTRLVWTENVIVKFD